LRFQISSSMTSSSSARILIIDDNPAIQADFRRILCPAEQGRSELEATLFGQVTEPLVRARFELSSAYQGHEAVEVVKRSLAENQPLAMAFVDVRMPPGWDGIETVAHIWEVDPQLQIVICTAYSDYSWEAMRAKVGRPDSWVVLKKPFDPIEAQQLAHALTTKWLLNRQANLQLSELERMVAQRTRELQAANQLLRISEERFAKAFHSNPIPSAIQSLPDQRLVDVNESFAALIGASRQELIGSTPIELEIWENADQVAEWFAQLARNNDITDQTTTMRSRWGGLREVIVSLTTVSLGEQPHALLLAQDISERLLVEQQLRQAQKMEAIGQFAAGPAHDFNNILAVIQGNAELLDRQLEPQDSRRKSTERIFKAASRATVLIRQLLMFSRKQAMQCRPLNLNDALGDTADMLQRLVGEHIELEFRPAESLPAVHADVTMIEQIVMNLAANSRDVMPEGGRITISTALRHIERGSTPLDPVARQGEFICLTVTDTGCGMDSTILSRIFEPFFTTKGPGRDTGLGLATVFGIVRQHQGWIEVESSPDCGATFRLYFPPSHESAESTEAVSSTPARRGRETILVAEDEEPLLETVAQVLREQGYRVLTALSGRKALKVWEESSTEIHLLVTDMMMPEGILGPELADRLKAANPRLKVIFTSGYSPGIAGKDLSLLEGRNFLLKPYHIGNLVHFVRECLDTPLKNY